MGARMMMGLFAVPGEGEDTLKSKIEVNDEGHVLANGQRLHYRDYGNAGGEVLLMVHGTSDSLLTWDRVDTELGRDFRLIGVDLPGHGFSGPAPDADYSRDAMNQSLELLLGERPLRHLFEANVKVIGVVEDDPRAAPVGIVAELRMILRKICELRLMAGMTSIVRNRR